MAFNPWEASPSRGQACWRCPSESVIAMDGRGGREMDDQVPVRPVADIPRHHVMPAEWQPAAETDTVRTGEAPIPRFHIDPSSVIRHWEKNSWPMCLSPGSLMYGN